MKASALLSINPEFQRNFWLELTPSRLVAAPVILFLILGGFDTVVSAEFAVGAAKLFIWILLTLWGSRLAAESLGDEISGHTWDSQRLSAQSPWGLTLGKLFGGTIFAWYAAGLCALGLIVIQHRSAGPLLGEAILGGLTAQSTALFAGLALNRFDTRNRRTHIAFAQFLGILAGWNSGLLPLPGHLPVAQAFTPGTVTWYGADFQSGDFFLIVKLISVAWLIFGSMRIVRRELGLIDGPLGWTLYTIYTLILTAGFVPQNFGSAAISAGSMRLGIPFSQLGTISFSATATVSLTYMAALGIPVALITLKKLSIAVATHNWREAWRNLPAWAPSFVLSATIGVILTIRLAGSDLTNKWAAMPLAVLGFVMRDIALIYLLRLTYRQRTTMALLILFVLLYGVLPVIVGRPGFGVLFPLFYPQVHRGFIGVAIPWAEAIIALLAVLRIMRKSARTV
jgi:hypothetical protein